MYEASLIDVLSLAAAILVLGTFALPLRRVLTGVAVGCNLSFIVVGLSFDMPPVWLVHLIILGLHLLRHDLGGSRKVDAGRCPQ